MLKVCIFILFRLCGLKEQDDDSCFCFSFKRANLSTRLLYFVTMGEFVMKYEHSENRDAHQTVSPTSRREEKTLWNPDATEKMSFTDKLFESCRGKTAERKGKTEHVFEFNVKDFEETVKQFALCFVLKSRNGVVCFSCEDV